jgi:hypothetical protein
MPGDRERFLVAGMDDYLAKPISLLDFEAVLRRWIPEEPEAAEIRVSSGPAATGAPAVPMVLDRAVLAGLADVQSGSQENLAHTIVSMFLEEAPRELDALRGHTETRMQTSSERLRIGCAGRVPESGRYRWQP